MSKTLNHDLPSTKATTSTTIASEAAARPAPSVERIAKLIAEARGLFDKLAPFTLKLDAKARRRTLKFRTGGDSVVKELGKLLVKYGLAGSKDFNASMASHLQAADQLAALLSEIASMEKALSDTVLYHRSQSWASVVQTYAVLEAFSRSNAMLKRDLEPVQAYFQQQKKRVKPPSKAAEAPKKDAVVVYQN
jgi:hypothetical protein